MGGTPGVKAVTQQPGEMRGRRSTSSQRVTWVWFPWGRHAGGGGRGSGSSLPGPALALEWDPPYLPVRISMHCHVPGCCRSHTGATGDTSASGGSAMGV